MYKVWGKASNRGFRVLWMLEEIGEPYELIAVGPHDPAVRAVNPSGKVPVLAVGGQAITDSTAILTFLAERHGKLTHPAGTVERARQDALIHCVLDEIESLLWIGTRHRFILPKERRVADLNASLKWEFARNIKALEQRFAGPFLQGEAMTIADIILTHNLSWARGARFPVESELLADYAGRMRRRDAHRRVAGMARAEDPG